MGCSSHKAQREKKESDESSTKTNFTRNTSYNFIILYTYKLLQHILYINLTIFSRYWQIDTIQFVFILHGMYSASSDLPPFNTYKPYAMFMSRMQHVFCLVAAICCCYLVTLFSNCTGCWLCLNTQSNCISKIYGLLGILYT